MCKTELELMVAQFLKSTCLETKELVGIQFDGSSEAQTQCFRGPHMASGCRLPTPDLQYVWLGNFRLKLLCVCGGWGEVHICAFMIL